MYRINTDEINYITIGDAIAHYILMGYDYIEVPWAVSYEAMSVTTPKNAKLYPLELTGSPISEDKYLVASAEQSFIQLMIDKKIDIPGKYVAATPCFRDDEINFFHKRYFFKVELIEIFSGPIRNKPTATKKMAEIAADYMYTGHQLKIVKTKDGLDITINGIEVGSYGCRKYKNFHWVYGTGLAEPRFSQANTKCAYYNKYKGKIKPKCGCGACWAKYYELRK